MTLAASGLDAVPSRWSMAATRASSAIQLMSMTLIFARARSSLEKLLKPHLRMKSALRAWICMFVCLCGSSWAAENNQPEYRIKADFLVSFAAFTEWPANVGGTLNLCVYGTDPFGAELDKYRGKSIGGRSLVVTRVNSVDKMDDCQIVFISRPAIDNLLRVLDILNGKPVLTVADSIGAMRQGVVLNMGTSQGRVIFEANLAAARGNGLNLSSKLLSLASEVKQ